MFQPTVFSKSLSDHRRGLIAWGVGSSLAGMMYASFYPQMKGDAADALANFPESMRKAFGMDDMASAAGYLQSTTFGLILPLLAMFYGIVTGARAVAGDEESGQLDQLLAHPITRGKLFLHRFGALMAGSIGISAVVWLAMLAVRSGAELQAVSPLEFLAQCLNLALLSIVFGAFAIALGAALGRRGVAIGIASAVGVLAYAMHSFGPQIGMDWAADLSPFAFYIGGEPLRNGFQWADAGVLAAIAFVCSYLGFLRFDRRDLNN
jgi:ABC-2 type transport system permease protein